MRRLFAAAVALAWLCGQPPAPRGRDLTEEAQYQPPEAVSVQGITEATYNIASGTVVLDVLVSEKGEVLNVQVRRDIVPLTEEAVSSVRTWTFEPARLDGKAATSRVTVAVTFNPPSVLAANVPLPPLIRQDDEARIQSALQPPEVTFAAFPAYPSGAIGPATAIVEATIDEAGKVRSTKVLRDVPPFTAKAPQAVERWRFMPGLLNGRPLESRAVLAFVFRQPYQSPLP
jgi:TonB family protein